MKKNHLVRFIILLSFITVSCNDNTNIILSSYDCVNGECIDPGNGSGIYNQLSACVNICSNASGSGSGSGSGS